MFCPQILQQFFTKSFADVFSRPTTTHNCPSQMSNKVSDHAHVETEDKEKKGKEKKEEVTLKLPKPTDDARAKWCLAQS